MKFFPKRSQKTGVRSQKPGVGIRNVAIAVVLVAWGGGGLRGELTQWAADVEAASKLEAVFFRRVTLPGGAVSTRRPPKETRPELSKLIAAAPNDAELYSLRALEAEQQLDFTAAEADWQKYIETSKVRGPARVALADFYHRRLKPRDELDAVTLAAAELWPDSEKLLPDTQQHAPARRPRRGQEWPHSVFCPPPALAP